MVSLADNLHEEKTDLTVNRAVLICEMSLEAATLKDALKKAGYEVKVVFFSSGLKELDLEDTDLIVIAPKNAGNAIDNVLIEARASGKTVFVATESPELVQEQWIELADEFLFEPFSFNEVVFRLDKKIKEAKQANNAGGLVAPQAAKRDAFMHALRALVGIMDARDAYARGHSARVSQLAKLIASNMKLPTLTRARLKFSGLFHDIGKIGIPDSIVKKPDKLTDEESAVMSEHPKLSVKIVEQITDDKVVCEAILYHHERFDGSGALGMKGDQIPLEARILAVAEAADTMMSDTPYRKALSREPTRVEIRKNKKTQFDPEVATGRPDLNRRPRRPELHEIDRFSINVEVLEHEGHKKTLEQVNRRTGDRR